MAGRVFEKVKLKKLLALLKIAFVLVLTIGAILACSQTYLNQTKEILIFFPNIIKNPESIDCAKGFPVKRKIPQGTNLQDSVRFLVEEYLKGPTFEEQELGYRSSVPTTKEIVQYIHNIRTYRHEHPEQPETWREHIADDDTTVRVTEVSLQNDTTFVIFSMSVAAYGGGSCRVAAILGPLRQTIFQIPHIQHVIFSIQGVPASEVFQP